MGASDPSPLKPAAWLAGGVLLLAGILGWNGILPDNAILESQKDLAEKEGIIAAPEGAATLAALNVALERGDVDRDERVVLFNTGSGLKYPMPGRFVRIDKDQPVDYRQLLATRADAR